MHTKSLHSSLTSSHEKSGETALSKAERKSEPGARIVVTLSERRAVVHERRATLAALTHELGDPTQRNLTVAVVDQHLLETSRLAAELLELAERADGGTQGSRAKRDGRGMRALADLCFDLILQIDAARHELADSLAADSTQQRLQQRKALRSAREALAAMESQLAQTLAN